jgi:hypothetical protein
MMMLRAALLVALFFLLLQCSSALRIGIQPKTKAPCEKRLCYEYYLDKMRGFLNGTA